MHEVKRELLDFIVGYVARKGFPPSIRDMCAAFGWGSTNAAIENLDWLESYGYILRRRGQSRAIQILNPEFKGAR